MASIDVTALIWVWRTELPRLRRRAAACGMRVVVGDAHDEHRVRVDLVPKRRRPRARASAAWTDFATHPRSTWAMDRLVPAIAADLSASTGFTLASATVAGPRLTVTVDGRAARLRLPREGVEPAAGEVSAADLDVGQALARDPDHSRACRPPAVLEAAAFCHAVLLRAHADATLEGTLPSWWTEGPYWRSDRRGRRYHSTAARVLETPAIHLGLEAVVDLDDGAVAFPKRQSRLRRGWLERSLRRAWLEAL